MGLSDLNTPPWLIEMVRQLDPRGIGLDPCSNALSMVGAHVAYTVDDDGLSKPWRGFGLTFVNPPHSQSPNNIEPWLAKAHSEFLDTDDVVDDHDQLVLLSEAEALARGEVPEAVRAQVTTLGQYARGERH